MKSFDLYRQFLFDSFFEVKNNFLRYLNYILILAAVENLDEVYKMFGGVEGDGWSLLLGLVSIVINVFIVSKIILLFKDNRSPEDKIIYIFIPYLLYSFYTSFIFFLGLLLFILPGIWFFIIFSQAPLIAALTPNSENYFKQSYAMVKNNIGVVALMSITSVIVEFQSVLFSLINISEFRLIVSAIFSVPMAILSIIISIANIKLFYYLLAPFYATSAQ